MPESTPINVQAFQPFDGGMGKRLTVTTVSGSGAIPGSQGDSSDALRILVTNGGSVSAFVRMGASSVIATLDCLEILPGTSVLLSPPFVSPNQLYLAAITESGSTKVQVSVGKGT